MSPRRLLPGALAALLATGCSSTDRIARENDRLREQVSGLERDVARLEDQNRQLAARLEEALAAPSPIAPEVAAAVPRAARISIGKLSHTSDESGDGTPDTLTVYVDAEDDRGRFVQIAGDLSVHAAVLPAGADAITIGRVTLGPAQVREAYRSTLLGTHYTLTVPIDVGAITPAPGDCSVRVVFHDGVTGLEHRAEKSIVIMP